MILTNTINCHGYRLKRLSKIVDEDVEKISLTEEDGRCRDNLTYAGYIEFTFSRIKREPSWIPPLEAWECAFSLFYGWEQALSSDGHLYFIK